MSTHAHMTRPQPAQTTSPCRVSIPQTGEAFICKTGETLLNGMLKLGRRGIPVGCVNGGCGVCKVQVTRGHCLEIGAVSRQHVTVEEEASGITLACRASPQTDVELVVIGKMQRGFVNMIVSTGSAMR
jgi:ferredoxin